MILSRRHSGALGLLWVVDLFLLLFLIPANAREGDVLIATGLWLVPTGFLAIATWLWNRHARA